MQAQGKDLQRVGFIKDKIRREFAAMVVSLDDGVGQIVQSLDEYGLTDNTLVIFLTDHGGDPTYGGSNTPLRGDKATLFEGGLKDPCVMKWPQKIKAGSESDAVLSSLDLFPTFCELAGASVPDGEMDGSSLRGHLLTGETVPAREFFWQTGRHAELERGTWTAARVGNQKYVQDDKGNEYLFDLRVDPNETTNLSNRNPKDFQQMKSNMRRLARTFVATE